MWQLRLVAFMLFAAVANAKDSVLNPGFELEGYGATGVIPEKWAVAGEGGAIVLDTTVAHSGRKSARLSREASPGFIGILQGTDVAPWAGKTVLARAWFRPKDAVGAAIFVRADALEVSNRRFMSVAVPQAPPAEWVQVQTLIEVPAGAGRVSFGATLRSGTLWVDSFELLDVDRIAPAPVGDKVAAYVDEAIGKIRAMALHADRVDWQRARARALLLAGEADAPQAAHESVRFLLLSLDDRHSFFQTPAIAAETQGSTKADHGIESRRIGRNAYISVPGFGSVNAERGKAFADDIKTRIDSMRSACGWIVDLRNNTGGNMFPMVTGLADFFDDTPLGYYVDRAQARTAWSLASVLPVVGGSPPAAGGSLRDAPVAVLIGPRTASSGEATLISFIGRPNTRTFGVPSAGRSTANAGTKLSDGAVMLITTAVMADRNGRAYGGQISPDELALGDIGAAKDGVIDAAVKWLETRDACAAVSEPKGTAPR